MRLFRLFLSSLVAATLCAGCGSGMNYPTAETDPGFDSDEPGPPPAKLEAGKQLRPGSRLATAETDEAPAAAPSRRTAELPPLITVPDNLAQWQPYDFHIARVTNDPRLVAAINLSKDRKIAANAGADAELFRGLLAPVKRPAKTAGAGPSSVRAATPLAPAALIEAIAGALAVNDSPAARRALEGMVTGSVASDDSRAAATAALRALASKPDDALDDLLFRLATTSDGQPGVAVGTTDDPEQPSPATSRAGALPRSEALAVVKLSGSARLRARLARHALETSAPALVRSSLMTLLAQPDSRNVEAQVVLYQSDRSDEALRTTLRKQLTQCSSAALASLLGVSTARSENAAKASSPVSQANVDDVVRCLWTSEFLQAVQRQRKGAESASERAQLIALGCTMPLDAVRQNLRRAFERSWDEGPAALESAGLAEGVYDPGLLPVLKTILPRTASAAPAKRPPVAVNAAVSKTLKIREQQEKTQKPWRQFVESVLRNQCKQYRAAALAREAAASPTALKAEDDDLAAAQPDGTLFKTAATAAYRLRWPDDLPKCTSGVSWDAMRVAYVRFEERLRPTTVARYYRRCLPGSREHELAQGLWVESLRPGVRQGTLRSTDVLITRAAGGVVAAPGEEQELTVEFLAVEINSPLAGEQVVGR